MKSQALYSQFKTSILKRTRQARCVRSQVRNNSVIIRTVAAVFSPFAFIILLSLSALAQSQTTGRIAGTVKDRTGAVITGADVTVVSRGTSDEHKVTTDAAGNYVVSLLPSGVYQVS